MIKFKKHDAVCIKSLDEIKKSPFYDHYDSKLERYCGTIQRIYAIYEDAWYKPVIEATTTCYKLEDTGFNIWSEDWLEPVFAGWEVL